MPRPFNPLPACPIPIQWDVNSRIQELQAMIEDSTTIEEQKVNLYAAIDLYNKHVLPGPYRFIQGGKVVKLQDVDFHRAWWSEGYGQQLSSQTVASTLFSASSESASACFLCFLCSFDLPAESLTLEQSLSQQLAHDSYPAGIASGHEVIHPMLPMIEYNAHESQEETLDRKLHVGNWRRRQDTSDDPICGLLLEYIEGTTLNKAYLPPKSAQSLRDQLELLHSLKIVQGDLFPHNMMVSKNGRAFLLDVSGAQMASEEGQLIRKTSSFLSWAKDERSRLELFLFRLQNASYSVMEFLGHAHALIVETTPRSEVVRCPE
ncbi:hypothetical protein LOY86_003874 [Ophidiomyces ophidiicola]|nr:hypothetical protein LOZ44_005098 [Ophidiomyces ophidiicola]KAI2451878.1 hypothetical protein LOY86_003874 [Ophidiomyces ophidiicola]